MTSWGRVAAVVWILLGLVAARPARAQSLADEADAHFMAGASAYDRFDYENALLHFMESNRLSPNPTAAGNVGHTFAAMKKYPEAYRWYALAQSLADAPLPELEGAMAAIRDKVVLVELTSEPVGARVYVNRRELGSIGTTPTTFALTPGSYTFLFEADGHADVTSERYDLPKLGTTTKVSATLPIITGHVVIGGSEGATVHLGSESGRELCVTPCEIDLPVGQQLLYFQKQGHRSQPSLVQVQQGATLQVSAELLQVTGSIRVEADQRGALVRVDGVDRGFTPTVINGIPAGTRVVEVVKTGFQTWRDEVEVPKDGQIDLGRVRLQLQSLTVVSASKTLEAIEETPVPVTVITSDMIAMSGVRNLKEALVRFVPGMTAVEDHNELNVAMRGIYASSQQKILVMIDGHRLNSRAYNSANPDYGISIDPDHVQQIEVLRGPGSSVYGNVALTAVVNIVTRPGEDLDRVKVGGMVGNFGQRGATAVGGVGLPNGDLRLWAETTYAEGEPYDVARNEDFAVDTNADGVPDPHAGTAWLGAAKDPASYDMGFRWRHGDFYLYGQRRYGKHTDPFTAAGITGLVYDPDQIPTIRSTGPGFGSRAHHFEGGVSTDLSDAFLLEANLYYDTDEMFGELGTGYASTLNLGWQDENYGGIAQLTGRWTTPLGVGSALVGAQGEAMRLTDSVAMLAADGVWGSYVYYDGEQVLRTGGEQAWSGYVQLKQDLRRVVLVNVGGRLDYKVRREGQPAPDKSEVVDFSPRLALILRPMDAFDLKLSYAESFVDTPYWYRYNTLPDYAGAVNLLPERLRAFQVTPTVRLLDGQLRSSTNVAYNQLSDFVFRDNEALEQGLPLYRNAGDLTTIVVEEELSYQQTWLRALGNLTWQRVLDVQDYGADPESGRINNVPPVVANVNVAVNPLFRTTDQRLWLAGGVRVLSAQLAPIQGVSIARPDAEANLTHEEPAVVLLDATVRAEDLGIDRLTVYGTAHNLAGTRWFQGGSTRFPYPQPGRWLRVGVEYAF